MSLLEDARKQINEVDKEIARLFEKRMQAVEDVAHYKQEHALPVLDQGREQEVLDRNVNYIENEKYKDSYLSMMKDMTFLIGKSTTMIRSGSVSVSSRKHPR
jgi:chorismate mutase/prephenate dehydratase